MSGRQDGPCTLHLAVLLLACSSSYVGGWTTDYKLSSTRRSLTTSWTDILYSVTVTVNNDNVVYSTHPEQPNEFEEDPTSRTTESIFVHWTDSSSGTNINYTLEWFDLKTRKEGSANLTDTSMNITGLEPGHRYRVHLYSVSNGVRSSVVERFFSTTPSGPPSVTLKKLGIFSQSLEATWDTVSGFNIRYDIRLISANKSLNNSSETTNSYTYHHLDQLTTYQVYVRAVVSNSSAKSEEIPSNQIKTGISGGIFAAIVVAILVIVTVFIAVLIVCRRRQSSPTNSTRKSQGIPTTQFVSYVEELKKTAYCELLVEYEHLKILGITQQFNYGNKPCNQPKNRLPGVIPNDKSRVVLLESTNQPGSDYINATWLPGNNSKTEYVVTQGPLPNTINDFWRMVWEIKAQAIIMLTGTTEEGLVKCEQYWPYDNEITFYGDVQVQIAKEVHKPSDTNVEYIIRYLNITQGDEMRFVKHIQYAAWPAVGLPDDPKSLLDFIKTVRTQLSPDKPTIVHCSTGIGRSGVFVVIDRMLQTIRENNFVDVYAAVKELWLHRPYIIQNPTQYIFIYLCLKYFLNHNLIYQFATLSQEGSLNRIV